MLINVGIMFLSFVLLTLFKDFASNLHAKVFALEPNEIRKFYFSFLANYKLFVIIFNLVPYLALSLIG